MKRDLPRALAQIGEIHALMGRTAVYRGYRSAPIAASGVIGVLAAALQPRSLGSTDLAGFVWYWTTVAVAAAAVGASEIVYNYVARDNEHARRGTRQVVGQFLSGVVAAAMLTLAFVRLGETARLLPAVWSICFAMGTFASLPYLPRAGAWVGLYYFAAGAVLLWLELRGAAVSGWHVGGTFGIGQLLAAAVLYLKVERIDETEDVAR
jgi:hypothetical protein